MFVCVGIAVIWEGLILQSQTEEANEVPGNCRKSGKKGMKLPEYFKVICFLVLFQISELMKSLLSDVTLREKNGPGSVPLSLGKEQAPS